MKREERPETIVLDFPACIAKEFPDQFPLAWSVVEQGVDLARRFDAHPLEKNHPALQTFNWETYLRCSVIRMVRVASRLRECACSSGRVLEYGSWFGNFGLMLAAQDFEVDAIDSYRAYSPAFDRTAEALASGGVTILDFADYGYMLESIDDGTYDVVLCLGVIEHIPHTPRLTLEAIDRVLKPGGLLVLDTPNLAYVYNREKLNRGESVFPAIWHQYFCQPPFHGHHREYTVDEVEWMLTELGHERHHTDLFNYSLYSGTQELTGAALDNYLFMESDPQAREYIMTVSSKPTRPAERRPLNPTDSEALDSLSATDAVDLPNEIRKLEEFLRRERARAANLSDEVGRRDELLQKVQRQVQDLLQETTKRDSEIQKRDEMLQGVQQQVQDLLQETTKRDQEIQKRDKMLQALRQKLDKTLEKAGPGLFFGLGWTRKLVVRMRRQLEESRSGIQERDQAIQERDSLLQEVQRQVQDSLAEVGNREAEIHRRDGLLQEVQRQVNDLMAQNQSRDQEVQKREGMLHALQRQVQDSLTEIGKREAEIQKRDDLLQDVQQQVQDSLVEIGKREAEIQKRDDLLKAMQQQVDGLAHQLRAKEEELCESRRAAEDGSESED